MMDFSQRYNRENFVAFLQNDFLPEDDFLPETTEAEIKQKTEYIKTITKLGTCKSLNLAVYEARHTSTNDARVGLSKEIFRFMANQWERKALVLFVPQGNDANYRFSLISIDLDENEKGNIRRIYSNPRRYSYYLGEGISYYTPNKYLNAAGRVKNREDLTERFSVDVLTKAFYQELSDWYAWAVKEVRFPNKLDDPKDDDTFNAEATIRLVTRLIFVWFLKQKHLIPEEFFDERYIADNLLKNFNPHVLVDFFSKSRDSRYYKAILQNLFFAMLNSPITPEGKSELSERHFRSGRGDYDNNKLMRYESMFKNPQLFIDLANKTVPFLNGGLFDCLDDKDNGNYVDGFSDRKEVQKSLIVPDYLFFGEEVGKNIDLSEWYGDKKKKKVSARGIIDILKRYNFTVEENTPFDQDVSLDPELLGKVFENLLASYNPETQTTARKQTGSFYTPREIVQYMVDESLVAHLKRTVGDKLEPAYRTLLQYTDDEVSLTDAQKKRIMQSLYTCKILDPACGSGAFPVGMLQQMVHILSRIDPDNARWKEMILDEATKESRDAFQAESKEERAERLQDIERSFDDKLNNPDYARKLYLIENCIYGVDIQSIAIQISKLRFFISLVVDQRTTTDPASNFGIRPLPNLEAKFVAANTLIPLAKAEANLGRMAIMETERRLKEANHKIFNAKTVKTKRKWKERLNELRSELISQLSDNGFLTDDAVNQLASWDMFNQNSAASFFDADWMFGIKDGFDIILGNPPYGARLSAQEKSMYRYLYPETQFKIDTYSLFVLMSMNNIAKHGYCTYIIPNTLLDNYFEEHVRIKLMISYKLNEINDLNDKVFNGAVVHAMIISFINVQQKSYDIKVNISPSLYGEIQNIPVEYCLSQDYHMISVRGYELNDLMIKISKDTVPLKDILDIRQAIKSGDDKKYISQVKRYKTDKPILRGKDIDRFVKIDPHLFLAYGNHLACPRQACIFEQPKILIREAGARIIATYDEDNYYIMSSLYNAILINKVCDLKYLLGIINSSLIQFVMNKLTFEKTAGAFTKAKIYHYYNLPIKIAKNQKEIVRLVDKIMNAKKCNPQVDISALDIQLDIKVYQLYGLSYDEVKIIDPDTPITREEYENC